MCGIVAVLRRPTEREAPALPALLATLDDADARFRAGRDELGAAAVAEVAAAVAGVGRRTPRRGRDRGPPR